MFAEESAPLMMVLFRHGHVSPSIPSDWKPWKCCCSALSGPFCCGGAWSLAPSRPLLPSAFFRVWVTVWVKPKLRSTYRELYHSKIPLVVLKQSTCLCLQHNVPGKIVVNGQFATIGNHYPPSLQVTIYHRGLRNTSPAPAQNLLCCKQGRILYQQKISRMFRIRP